MPRMKPDKNLAAACGLFCPGCTLYIGTMEDRERLEKLAAAFGMPIEKLQCEGCRTENRGFYCDECKMTKCTEENGIDFCGACDEYPCREIKEFQAAMPHRIELWDNLKRIEEVGFEAWFDEMIDHYACPECGALNSAYDVECRKCGRDPACEYVNRHKNAIQPFLKMRGG